MSNNENFTNFNTPQVSTYQVRQEQRGAPPVSQIAYTQPSSSGRITPNVNYLCSIAGIVRLAIIIFQFAAWVSAAAVPKLKDGNYYLTSDFAATRSAYLFFSIVGFIGSIVLFVIHFLNVVHFGFFAKIPWVLVILITDIIWFFPTLILGIVAAVRESQISSIDIAYQNLINTGAFASAAFFAFLCAILYALDGAFHLIKVINEGYKSKPPAA